MKRLCCSVQTENFNVQIQMLREKAFFGSRFCNLRYDDDVVTFCSCL